MRSYACFIVMMFALAFGVQYANADKFVHTYPAELTNIVDADTMDMTLHLGLGVKMDVRVRIQNYDAPETWRPKSLAEDLHGQQATDYAREILPKTFTVKSYGWVVYNRVEVEIELADGRDFAAVMIEEGFSKQPFYLDQLVIPP
tara:strand:- start:332 stop:766 length:435 start_codon:yes stop_codon:yes gene_type:complete